MTTIAELWNQLSDSLLPMFAGYREHIVELPVEIKADQTLLTEADTAIQRTIIEAIQDFDPGAIVIAEEDERTQLRAEILGSAGRIWVVDPIDGTAEFVRDDRVEFCSVVCLLEDWQPSAAFVLAPELGTGRTAITVTGGVTAKQVHVNGHLAGSPDEVPPQWLSLTRSEGSPSRHVDESAQAAGYRLKTRTTSQTLDMVRTVVDLHPLTSPPLPRFALFHRREQKLWDGVAGLALGRAVGLSDCDESGAPLSLAPDFLAAPTPVFASTVMGQSTAVSWFLENDRP